MIYMTFDGTKIGLAYDHFLVGIFHFLSYFKLQFRDETQTKLRNRDRERTQKKYQFKVNDNKYFHRMSAETGGH